MKVSGARDTGTSVLASLTLAAPQAAVELPDVRALYLSSADAIRTSLRRLTGEGPHLDDLLQDVFLIALKSEARLLSASSPRAWLYGIATKVAANHRRRRWVRDWLGLEKADPVEARLSPLRALEQRDSERLVATALRELSGKKREVFVLFELEGLSGAELAEALDVPVATVWTRLFHARKEFAAVVARLEGAP